MQNLREVYMIYMRGKSEKFGDVLAEKKVTYEFKYDQIWKIWQYPLSLSLYSTFKELTDGYILVLC